jgi:hypothetical protein
MAAPSPDPSPAASGDRWAGFWSGCTRTSAFVVFVWESALWLSAFVLLPLLIVYWLVLVYDAAFTPPSWYYSVSARSEAASLTLPADRETSWRIEGATVCSTAELPGLELAEGEAAPCGSRRWQAYKLPVGEEQVLVLGGATAPGTLIEIGLETHSGRGLMVSIRGAGEDTGIGTLRLVDEGKDLSIRGQINLVWPDAAGPRNLVFPFIADRVRVGRDVTWSDASLLHEGRMEIFSASDENLSKRMRIEETELLPGDQIRLERYEGETPLQPKGFLRLDRAGAGEASGTLTAVVFGRAESVKIERFGDSGYDFRPPWWAGISQNQRLITVSTLIAGLLGLLGGYAAFRDIHARSPNKAWEAFRRPCAEANARVPGDGDGADA